MTNHLLLENLYKYRRYIWYNAWYEMRYRYDGMGMGGFYVQPHYGLSRHSHYGLCNLAGDCQVQVIANIVTPN